MSSRCVGLTSRHVGLFMAFADYMRMIKDLLKYSSGIGLRNGLGFRV